ncbi:MAG: sulfatase-like hydrolase/transferase, partial [Myxococcota bacterium]
NAYMTDYLSSEAVKAIEANRNRPFLLYLAYNAPHTPLQSTRADYEAVSHIESHAERVYAAMMRALDRGVGQVLDALETNGLAENTLVFFSSDNGGAHYIGLPEVNQPYRGWKMTFFEGGLHTPFFIKWPAGLPADVRVDQAVTHIDVFSTAAAAAGIPVPADRPIDGVDLLPYARGEKTGVVHDAIFWRSGGLQVVLSGDWKCQVDKRQDKMWLFNLKEDPTEQTNLIAEEKSRADALQKLLDEYNQEVGPRHFPAFVEGVVPIDRTLAQPYEPGEEWAYWPN